MPTGRVVIVKLAVSLLTGELPRLVLPLLKVTVPVATPLNCPEILAVNVTDCPNVEGFSDDFKVVEELALLTVWDRAVGAGPSAKLALPRKVAVMESVPAVSVVRVSVAVPATRPLVPRLVVPL